MITAVAKKAAMLYRLSRRVFRRLNFFLFMESPVLQLIENSFIISLEKLRVHR